MLQQVIRHKTTAITE